MPLRTAISAVLVIGSAIFAALALPQGSAARDPVPRQSPQAPALIELFTSQGCSSCPPADRLAARLDGEAGLVVISRPVDYWDRLGWVDTFASPANTALQRAYRERGLGGYNGVYTPQAVIDGQIGEIGSNEPALRRWLARKGTVETALNVRSVPGKGFAIGIAGDPPRPAELVVIGVKRRASVAIGRGENTGRRVTYTNVLIQEQRIASWDGGAQSIVLTDAGLPGSARADRHALILRVPDGGPVLTARWLD